MAENINISKRNFIHVGQDWATVISGFVLIFLTLFAGYNIKVPSFGDKAGWSNFETLSSSFSNGSLFTPIAATFVLFLCIAVIGLFFSGDKPKKFLVGYSLVFLLALIAQLLSSYLPFKNLGLETVLFSLAIGLMIGHVGNLRQDRKSVV